ncbi:MAG: signal peptidase I [Bacilli bacterium]|nr:signal peptidase I [Bacilli bacterium]
MKVGYKRLLNFIICTSIILLLTTLIIKTPSRYQNVIFLSLLLIVFNRIFIIERDRHRYLKDILFEILLFTLTYFVFFYLLGFIVGITKTNYYNLSSIVNIIIPITLYIILREILRYNMLCKADGNKNLTILVVILFILFDIFNSYHFTKFSNQYELLKFISLLVLPVIAKNISYSYVSKKMGYKPVIVFELIFVLYPYLLPVIPNPNAYIMSVIYLLVPVLFAYKISKFFNLRKDDLIPRDYMKKKFTGIMLPTIIIIILVYFYSGYFRYFAIAIASGSMEPKIYRGDIVIVDQKFSNLKKGDVIAFKQNNIIIVHRIVKIIKYDKSNLYYTKGDANNKMDDFITEKDMIVGKVKIKLPLIGYPTVWFNRK